MANEFDPYYTWLGIPPKDQPPHYYRLLGLELFESDQNIIASAAKQRYVYLEAVHTDANIEIAQQILDEVTVAGKCLLKRQSKAKYDHQLKSQLEGLDLTQDIPQAELMPIIAPINISNIIKTKDNNQKIQLGSAFIGVLLIFGVIATAWSIYKTTCNIPNAQNPSQRNSRLEAPGEKTANVTVENKKLKTPPNSLQNKLPNNPPKIQPTPLATNPKKEPDLSVNDIVLVPQQGPTPVMENELNANDINKLFKFEIFDIDMSVAVDALKKSQEQVNILHYPDQRVFSLAMHDKGVLDGVCVAFYKNGNPMTYANYKGGYRHGIVKTWNEKGENVYWCQYDHGPQHGLCCFFKNSQLCLVLQINRNKIQSITLVTDGKKKKSFNSEADATKDDETKRLYSELEALEDEMNNNQSKFKDSVRDEERRLRQERASDENTKNRAAIQERINLRRMESQKYIDNIRNFRPLSQSYRFYIIQQTKQ